MSSSPTGQGTGNATNGLRVCEYCTRSIKPALDHLQEIFSVDYHADGLTSKLLEENRYPIDRTPAPDADCYVCRQIMKQDPQRTDGPNATYLFTGSLNDSIKAWGLYLVAGGVSQRFDVLQEQYFYSAFPQLVHEVHESTWNPRSVEFSRKCLQDCLSKHTSCRNNATKSKSRIIPSRLILLGRDGNHLNAKLVEKATLQSPPPYFTLSHCWGSIPFTTLSTSNYEQFLEGVPLNDPMFNPLFRDAMQVTLDLGYEYLWIDSLCIVQGTPDSRDWARECPSVGEYYAGADVNLSASGFANGQSGLFRSRDPPEYSWASLSFERHGVYVLSMRQDVMAREGSSPLIKRGWVTQERLFSNRTLQFYQDMILWECCEDAQNDISIHEGGGTLEWFRKKDFRDSIFGRDCLTQDDRQKLLDNWYRNVAESYSSTKLTYPQDKLPAISSLAAAYGRLLGTGYLAGHWEQNLLQSLAWTLYSYNTEPKAVNVAPSWSWASTNSRVSFYDLYTPVMPVSTIIHASAQRATSDPWGAVTTCRLRIRGPLHSVDGLRRSLAACPPRASWQTDTDIPGLDGLLMGTSTIPHDQNIEPPNIFLLPLFIAFDFRYVAYVHCLILQKAGRVDAKSFERIGVYRMRGFKRPESQMDDESEYMGRDELYEVFRGLETEVVEII